MPSFDGKLVIHINGGTQQRELRVLVAGEAKPRKIQLGTLHASFGTDDLDAIAGTEVSCELAGKPDKPKPGPARYVRPVGAPTFVNPYTFVPAPPRNVSDPELGDRAPVGHHRFHPDRWSGQIRVVIETVTPLLIPDASRARTEANDHKVMPLRLGPDDLPYLPPTSVKGMLRAAYEAVTNSRFGVWDGHAAALTYRASKAPFKRPYPASPATLLGADHHPARTLDELSPADRVFGWVNGSGSGAYRGALRVGPCTTEDAVERFEGDGVPLAILGEPKPAQGRFYAAADPHGTPLMRGVAKKDLYAEESGLRGRKVYLHHGGLPDGYWQNPVEDRTQDTRHGGQEYRRPDRDDGPQRDNKNRSVPEWVRPGKRFETTISVQNLSAVELGALLWLLQLPEGHHHRLGGAKPLGFGSVTVRIDRDRTSLRLGRARADAYRTLGEAPESGEWERLPGEFEAALHQIHEPGERVGILESFLRAAAGPVDDGVRVHYPRVTVVPDPEGKQYEWFTANDRGGQIALPAAGEALPLHDGA